MAYAYLQQRQYLAALKHFREVMVEAFCTPLDVINMSFEIIKALRDV
jgi:hypothetical protein